MKTRNISPKMMSFINVTISLLINIVLLLLLVKNNYFSYATNDDFDMTLSVTGAYGKYSPYTLFSGYWIGLALKYLYQFFPICNWITIINISAIFIFFVYFFNLLLRKGKLLGASLGIALILIAYPYLYNLNYTKTAAIITLLGLTIMSELIEQIYSSCFVISKRVLCLQIFIAYLLIFIGAQIRIEPMLFMLVYIIPFIFHFYKKAKHLFKNNIHIKTSDMHPFLVYITWGGGAILALSISSEIINHNNPDLHFYYAHNEARIEYLDHQSLDYNEYSNEFKALGLSENDYKMFMSAHYYDTNVFNDDCLNSMVQLKHNNSKLLTKEKIIEALSVFKDEIMSYSLISFGLILAFYFLITSEYTLELVSTLTITAFEIAYLVIGGRYPIRVLFIPMLGCLVIIVYFCLEHFNQYLSSNKNRYYIVILFILCYVILSSGFLTLKKQNGWGGDKEKVMSLVQELNKNPENLYVWDDYSVDLFGAYSQYEIVDYNILENVVFDWDWKVMLPVNIQKTSDFLGDSNIYLHSINDNIYWVGSNNIDIKRAFIREHYYEDIDYAILCYIEDEPIISFTRNINYYNTLPTSYIVSFDMKANDIDNLINITISNIKGLDITSYDKIYIQLSDVTEATCYTYECYMLEHNTLETNIPQNTWNEIDLVNCSLLLNANNNIFIVPYDYSISL